MTRTPHPASLELSCSRCRKLRWSGWVGSISWRISIWIKMKTDEIARHLHLSRARLSRLRSAIRHPTRDRSPVWVLYSNTNTAYDITAHSSLASDHLQHLSVCIYCLQCMLHAHPLDTCGRSVSTLCSTPWPCHPRCGHAARRHHRRACRRERWQTPVLQ